MLFVNGNMFKGDSWSINSYRAHTSPCMIGPVGPPYVCVSCSPAVMTPPLQRSGNAPCYHPMYQTSQPCSLPVRPAVHTSPALIQTAPMKPINMSGSPVLSTCSGQSEQPATDGAMNPGLNLLCRAVEEAQTVQGENPQTTRAAEAPRVKGPWRADEDRLLCDLVEKFGPRRWTAIASFIAGRTGKQSRERWLNHLNPKLSKRQWTDEEDRIIMKAHGELGNKWSEIAKLLKGRTDNAVKNRFNTTIRRQISEYSFAVRSESGKRKLSDTEDEEGAESVKRMKTENIVSAL